MYQRYSSQELGLMAVLRKIGYSSRPIPKTVNAFTEENKQSISQIETFEKYPSQRAILLSHFKTSFANEEYNHKYDLSADFIIEDQKFEKAVKTSCYRISRALRKRLHFKIQPQAWATEDFIICIVFVLQKNARLGNRFIIRPNDKDIKEIGAIRLNKRRRTIETIGLPPSLQEFFITLLQNEINADLITLSKHQESSWKKTSDSLLAPSNPLEIEEVGLRKTDFYEGDKITIKPFKGDAKRYLEAILNQKDATLLKPENFNLSYFDFIKIRRSVGKSNCFKFELQPNGAIVIRNKSKYQDRLLEAELAKLGLVVDKEIIDLEITPREKILQQIIIQGFLPVEESRMEMFASLIQYLNQHQLIKRTSERNLYRCTRSSRCYSGSAFKTKMCPVCGKKDRSIRFTKGLDVVLNNDALIAKLKTILQGSNIKYRRLKTPFYNNKYYLHKISMEGLPEINLYFNEKGLNKWILKDFTLCPRPLVCINLKGEVRKFPEFIHQEDGAKFIEALCGDNPQGIINSFKQLAESSGLFKAKEISFKASLEELKSIMKNNELETNKGNKYERLTANLFNYIFPLSDKWGGKNLPDGIIGLQTMSGTKFVFWDAKRYDDTKLSKYASKPKDGVVKDLQYVIESLKQEDTYNEGKLAYYLFVTSSTHKDDFAKVQNKIAEIIEKNKYIMVSRKGKKRRKKKLNPHYNRLKEIKFCCLNLNELIMLGRIFDNVPVRETLTTLQKNVDGIFEEFLTSNSGYVEMLPFETKIKSLIQKKPFMPDKSTHKRSGLDIQV